MQLHVRHNWIRHWKLMDPDKAIHGIAAINDDLISGGLNSASEFYYPSQYGVALISIFNAATVSDDCSYILIS
jgi:hypothetical protein